MAGMKAVVVAAILAAAAAGAYAQPVKCVDASGKSRYVDATQVRPGEKCAPIENKLEVVPAPPGAPGGASSSSASGSAAAAGDDRLKEAEKRLAEARQKLTEQEAIRTGDERNYQRVLDRLKPYQDAVESAQRDLDQARRDAR
jgi:hypothetical protein